MSPNDAPPPSPDAAGAPFVAGSRVRVRKGVKDPDYPDIPLGGWTGTVLETQQGDNGPTYLVEWDEAAVRQMHPVYRRRCERDGLDLDTAWLEERDLEANVGGPVEVEQPGTLTPRPLDPGDQEDRVRAVFDLTSDDELPKPDRERLAQYQRFLSERLRFPLDAQYAEMDDYVPGREAGVKFVGLAPMEQVRVENGLLAEIEQADGTRAQVELFDIETPRNDYVRQLLGDYSYWFCEAFRFEVAERGRQQIHLGRGRAAVEPARWALAPLLLRCGAYGALCGMVVGAITATIPWAPMAMVVAGGMFASVGYFLGSGLGKLLRALRLGPHAPRYLGSLVGAFAGAVVGVVVGPLMVAFAGTVFGSIAGVIVGHTLAKFGVKWPGAMLGGLLGASAGGVALACLTDLNQATFGLLIGAGAGAVLGVALILLLLFSLAMFEVNQEGQP